LPFGSSDSTTELPDGSNINLDDEFGNIPVSASNQPIPRLRKISNEPTAGAAIWNVGTTTFVRWVEKGTGNVYQTSSASVNIERLTNTTIPKIVRAFWLPDGSGFLAQTIIAETEIIETSFVALSRASIGANENLTPFTTRISKLPTGIKEISVSGDGKKIFYYTLTTSANFYISNPDGTNEALVFTHPLTEWLPRYWVSNTSVLLQTKEGVGAPARFYNLNTATKTLTRASSPLASVLQNTFILLDKCALPVGADSFVYCAVSDQTPAGTYPDDWYKGLVSTSDSLRQIDTEHDVYYHTANLTSISGEKIDVVDLDVATDQSHLIFRNKIDGFLWLLRISDE